MEVKLKASEMLLRKLSFGCGDAQLQAVAEIRLFAKWDDVNRLCLGRVGAIGALIKVLQESTAEARVQENAMLALLNISIHPENKVRMVHEDGSLQALMQLANEGESGEVKANAVALLYSLIVDDEARKILGMNESLWSTLLALLRDGSSKCKAEALKVLFVGAGDNLIRERLLQENYQLIALLISMVTVGKVKLTEDCLAVLALLAGCSAGAAAIAQAPTSIPVLVYLVNSGSSARVQENAVSVLLKVCQNDQEAQKAVPLQALIPALNSLYWGGSERGRGKAEDLLTLLGFDIPTSRPLDPNPNFNYRMKPASMPYLPTHPLDSVPPLQSSPLANPPSSSCAPFSNASWPKSSSRNKYFNFAKKLFTHRPSKKNQSTTIT